MWTKLFETEELFSCNKVVLSVIWQFIALWWCKRVEVNNSLIHNSSFWDQIRPPKSRWYPSAPPCQRNPILAGSELADQGAIPSIIAKANTALHNVHFGYYVYLPTEQAETYLKSCVLINYSTYICLCLFGWKVNMILKETVTFKL